MMLKVEELRKMFGGGVGVQNVSFTVGKGKVLGLLGHNGAGKSTTIKMILGIIESDEGCITWDGEPFKRSKVSVGYLPEERGLYEKTKVGSQLFYFGKLENMTKDEAEASINYWLNKLDIPSYKTKYVHELSKGNKQKIQFIAALLHNPELIILDEPFSGLDPINAEVFSNIISELIEKGKTVILSSHRMEQMERFCQDIVLLKNGEVVLKGELDSIQKKEGAGFVEVKAECSLSQWFESRKIKYTETNEVYKIPILNTLEAYEIHKEMVEAGIGVRRFILREKSLHEIFVEKVSAT
ncbi:ATP-binding cassette domain-containing protein (plasmid) [Pontibacillus sp. ALD_SL1]|uniref:ABC transporter ATP-binding protein n=1 Tax=Pontibacillus sp. ALD_SL1 TaxID=2777185 RepID=UPI001A970981|nr:ATP-binding cassette domain-containing protein [Pontibacillus sp. ALD_SL1]QST03119.1 ATP-binding cassette domain-containing protein [Pontibacillus sp. ALD_SL1]